MQITITRGLSELKLLSNRIHKAINEGNFIAMTTGKRPVTGYSNNEDFGINAKSQLQSVQALIKRRNAIKAAIVQSNATTMVKIGEQEMTVAEAIERKSAIEYERALLAQMKRQYSNIVQRYDQEEEQVKARLDKHLESIFGRDVKIDKGVQEEESKVFMDRNEPKIIDPLNLKSKIEDLEELIEEFESHVDFSLSESNSITKIEIPD